MILNYIPMTVGIYLYYILLIVNYEQMFIMSSAVHKCLSNIYFKSIFYPTILCHVCDYRAILTVLICDIIMYYHKVFEYSNVFWLLLLYLSNTNSSDVEFDTTRRYITLFATIIYIFKYSILNNGNRHYNNILIDNQILKKNLHIKQLESRGIFIISFDNTSIGRYFYNYIFEKNNYNIIYGNIHAIIAKHPPVFELSKCNVHYTNDNICNLDWLFLLNPSSLNIDDYCKVARYTEWYAPKYCNRIVSKNCYDLSVPMLVNNNYIFVSGYSNIKQLSRLEKFLACADIASNTVIDKSIYRLNYVMNCYLTLITNHVFLHCQLPPLEMLVKDFLIPQLKA